MTFDPDVLRRSVTRGDHTTVTQNGYGPGIIQFLLAAPSYASALPGPLPSYWSRERDRVLRATVYQEAMWSSAVAIATTKMASLGWSVDSTTGGAAPYLTKRSHNLLHTAEGGKGWVTFLSKHLRDYTCTDNGAFIEVIRATSARGSRIIGIMHLDSLRCTRTGDPKFPLFYRDKLGQEHIMRDHQVLMLADMSDPSDIYNGVGLCAASRAHPSIMKLSAIEQYLWEKVSGSRALAIHLVKGITRENMQSALETADQSQIQKGAVIYKGAVVVPFMSDATMELVTIPLAELPDGFDRKDEFDLSILTYANALGLDVQDLQPLSGQALGTGAQSQVLDDKSSGKGLAAWRQQFVHLINEYVVPGAVTFQFIEKDYRDLKAQNEIDKENVELASNSVESGIITPQQALQYLVDKNVFPKEFIQIDETPALDLSDNEKPEELNVGSVANDDNTSNVADDATASAQDAPSTPFMIDMSPFLNMPKDAPPISPLRAAINKRFAESRK